MIIVTGIRLPLGASDKEIISAALKTTGIRSQDVRECGVRKRSFDARHGEVSLICSASLALVSEKLEEEAASRMGSVSIAKTAKSTVECGNEQMAARPIVIGYGPAGMFAAYQLARHGYAPIVFEQGASVDERTKKVEHFFLSGELDIQSNVQFGEGGAGTFSDGKLTTRINDPLCDFVLETFCSFGAPREILMEAKPHIGTDVLRSVIKGMREKTVSLGAQINFKSKLEDIIVKNGIVTAVVVNGSEIPAQSVILACGHSSRDVFSLVARNGANVVPKPFSVGFRIEHLQSDIDRCRWGKYAGDPRLPAADYALSEHINGRGVYTFCMCPGGSVVAGASESGGVVTNGMSNHDRAGKNANSAIVVSVDGRDFGNNAKDALEFQRKLEATAYRMGGGGYKAPASDVGSFLSGRSGLKLGRVEPSYPLSVTGADLGKLVGKDLSDCLKVGLTRFSKKINCFAAPDSVLTGIESRTSSPVRIVRQEDRVAENIKGLYPCGEGAGYAGGIMSSATDGLNTASAIIGKYKPF